MMKGNMLFCVCVSGRGCMFRTIQMCIFGSPEEKTSLEEGPYRTAGSLESTETGDTSMYHSCLKLVFCVIGLQVTV